jgi:lipoate-protein ligase A
VEDVVRLRVIDFEHVPPLDCEAAYHGLAAAMEPGGDAILCLVNPDETYVSAGRFQVIAQELDRERCRAQHLPVIRRHTGGGVALVDRNQMLMHFIMPRRTVTEPVVELYPRILEPLVRTCRELGLAAEFNPINEIYVSDRKAGAADAGRIGEAVLVACNLMFDVDLAAMANCLKSPSDAFREKLLAVLEDSVTTVLRELHTMPQREEVRRLFLKECTDCLGAEIYEDEPTEIELSAIGEWTKRLADDAWTLELDRKVARTDAAVTCESVPADAIHVTAGGLISVHLLDRDGVIAELVLSGDFSCIPAERLETLSHRMVGEHLDEASLAAEAERTMQDIGVQMPGIAPADIAAAIMAAYRD